MLDVHVPKHGLHGVREFLLHILTITVGLLIALGLESAAEAVHHRHQRQEAEATIRQELAENRDKVRKAQATVQAELKNMVAVLDFLQARGDGVAADAQGLNIEFQEGPLQDAAWRTAASTGVLTFMEYAQVEKYSVAYKEQADLESMQQRTLDEYLQLQTYVVKGFDPKSVTADVVKEAQPVVRRAIARLSGMVALSRGALQAYDDALR